jgi:peptide/nickel transport system substrate-binding protein
LKRFIIPLAILLILASILAGCGEPAATTPSPTTPTAVNKFGGTLRIIEIAAPGAPLGAEWEGNLGTYNTQQWVMERLLKEQIDGTMKGELAETWDVVNTGNVSVTFHLRQGVTFHDGTPWNADALAWNLNMYKTTGMYTATTNYWASWDKLGEYTLRVNYTKWSNHLLRSWENYFMASPTAYDVHGIEWMRTNMVGTGAFMQSDYQKDVSLTAVRNPNYWQKDADGNKLPYLDGVKLLYVADETQRENLMKSGGAEMLNSSTKQAARFKDVAGFTILNRSAGPNMLAPDSKNADSPYSDLNVRLAVEYAIDREALATSFGYGYDKPAYQMSSPSSKAYDSNLQPRLFNLDTARHYLSQAKAEWADGFDTTIYVGPGANRDPVIAIQAMLAKININVDLQFPEPAAWQATTTQPAPVSSLISLPINEWSNYNTTLNVFFSGLGFYLPSNQKPAGYVDLFNASLAAPAPDPVILKQISDAFYNDCTIFPTVYSTFVFVVTPNLQDSGLLTYGTFNAWDYAKVWLKK